MLIFVWFLGKKGMEIWKKRNNKVCYYNPFFESVQRLELQGVRNDGSYAVVGNGDAVITI